MALFECPECKSKIERETGKCSYCGVDITICPKCDTVDVGEVGFCRICGTDLQKYRKAYRQTAKAEPIPVSDQIIGEFNESGENDLISCLRDIEIRNVLYRILGVLKAVVSVFFWTFLTIACVGVVVAAAVVPFLWEEQIEGTAKLLLSFLNVLAIGSGLPVLMTLFYRLLIKIPHSIIGTFIVGVCSRKYAFSRHATIMMFKNPSLAYGMDEAFSRAHTIYPFLVKGSKGRGASVVLDIFDYFFQLISPLMLAGVYVIYLIALALSRYLVGGMFFEDSISVLLFPVVIGGVCLAVGIVLVCILKAIFDIVVDNVNESLINKWADALYEEEKI